MWSRVDYPFDVGVSTAPGQWFPWTPSSGSLSIVLPLGGNVGTIWVPNPTPTITFATQEGVVFYELTTAGAELVPIPANLTEVVLSGTSAIGTYIWATGSTLPPYKAN